MKSALVKYSTNHHAESSTGRNFMMGSMRDSYNNSQAGVGDRKTTNYDGQDTETSNLNNYNVVGSKGPFIAQNIVQKAKGVTRLQAGFGSSTGAQFKPLKGHFDVTPSQNPSDSREKIQVVKLKKRGIN
jgi:hypothetical protein